MKKNSRNPWDILGVTKDASQQEIRDAFRKLALKWHPDRPSGDLDQFRKINNAYNKLKNKQMIPIIESPPTRLINVKLTIDQQLNGINDYIQVDEDLYVKVKIPAGAISGDKYRITDNGQTFIINVQEKLDEKYQRHGFSLFTTIDVDIITAMTGGKFELEGPNKQPLTVDIPSGISHNDVITIKNVGLLNRRSRDRGSLHITVNLIIPEVKSQSDIDDFISRLIDVRNRKYYS